jgi:hypothetical protein
MILLFFLSFWFLVQLGKFFEYMNRNVGYVLIFGTVSFVSALNPIQSQNQLDSYNLSILYFDYQNMESEEIVSLPGTGAEKVYAGEGESFDLVYHEYTIEDQDALIMSRELWQMRKHWKREIQQSFRKRNKSADRYADWLFKISYRPIARLENLDTEEVFIVFFQEDKGYVIEPFDGSELSHKYFEND